MTATFAVLCDLAATFGMGVDLECMACLRVSSFPQAVRVVAEAGRPNGGALIDALHLSRTGGTPQDVRRTPASLIRSAQLCDAVAERPSSNQAIIQEARSGRLPPGRSALPLRDLLDVLPGGGGSLGRGADERLHSAGAGMRPAIHGDAGAVRRLPHLNRRQLRNWSFVAPQFPVWATD